MAQNRRSFNHKAISQQKRELKNALRDEQVHCEHKNPNGPTLTSVHDDSITLKNKSKYSDKMFVCDQCNDLVPLDAYKTEDADKAFEVLYGMCNQAKLLANLTDTEYETIVSIIETLDSLNASLTPFYLNKIIKPLRNNNKGKNNGGGRAKGKISIGKSFGR